MIKMKNSGVEWIGDIPIDWEIDKIGSIYEERNTKVSDKDFPPLSVTKRGIVPQLENAAKTDNGDNRKLIKKNDFVINSRSDRRGSCGISEYDGSCSLINTVLKPRKNMSNTYYSYVFRSELFADEFYRWGNGIVDDLWSTKWSNMKNIYIPSPSLETQHRIADYLDKKCAKIDAIIEKQQSVIEKLKEYKLSLITETVTKGLNSYVTLKDSGVDWLGEIPDSWEIIRVKQLLTERKERSVNGTEEPLSMCQKLGLVPTYMLDAIPNMASSYVGAKLTYVNDLVFNKLKAHLGVFSVSKYNGLVSPDYSVYYSTGKANLKYLEYVFKTPQCISEFSKRSSGIAAGLTRLYTDGLFTIKCPFPKIEEQQRIANFLDIKIGKIDAILQKKQNEIDKLTEYKKSLIYEVVTGKKEV